MLQSQLAEYSLKNNEPEICSRHCKDPDLNIGQTSHLLDSLLEYARIELTGDKPHVSEFPLSETLFELGNRCRLLAEQKNLNLRIASSEDLLVCTDPLRLERILTNLIDNAIKFTPVGSVRVEVECDAKNLEIHVIDSGVGIEPDLQQQLFDEFFQVNNHERDRSKGFGMGLSIARRLARQLGGDISVDSALGRGSRFSLHLPGVVRQTIAEEQLQERNQNPAPARSAG